MAVSNGHDNNGKDDHKNEKESNLDKWGCDDVEQLQ